MMRVLIADDHPVVRQGIRQIVSAAGDIAVVAEAANGAELFACLASARPDIVLLDLTMPGSDGLDLLKRLRRETPEVRVLILTMHAEEEFAVRTLKAGAAGYLTKESAPDELVGALRRIRLSGRYLSSQLAEKLADHLEAESAELPHEQLSDREYQVFRMLARGRSTRDIATALRLSVKTINTYRSRLFLKMRMKSTAELATYVERNRLSD